MVDPYEERPFEKDGGGRVILFKFSTFDCVIMLFGAMFNNSL